MTMDTKALLAEAEALKPQLLTDRRTLHRDPEVGYEPVVYMNLHWAGSMYGMEELAHLPVWLASYGPVPALDRGVTLWQYSESGVVDGIEGPVDLDLWFTEE